MLVGSAWLVVWALAANAQTARPLAGLESEGPITYYIGAGAAGSGYAPTDHELAVWALRAWEKSAQGALEFAPSAEAAALVRVYFVPPGTGQYGETRALLVGERRGAVVYVRPDTNALGADIAERAAADPLLRDVIVYLTCVHELGHALGLEHTADFADVMYSFQFGGDIPAFFGRYRDRLVTRSDIAREPGLSSGDIRQLTARYPRPPAE
jgi:hypothetical protein